MYNSVPEAEKIVEDIEVDGVARWERAGHVSAGALVG